MTLDDLLVRMRGLRFPEDLMVTTEWSTLLDVLRVTVSGGGRFVAYDLDRATLEEGGPGFVSVVAEKALRTFASLRPA